MYFSERRVYTTITKLALGPAACCEVVKKRKKTRFCNMQCHVCSIILGYYSTKHSDWARYSVGLGLFKLAFPTGRDSASFWDKGTEVPSLSWDKRTIRQAENLTKRQVGTGQPVKIRDGMLDEILKACPVPYWPVQRNKMGQSRKVSSKMGKRCYQI